MLKGKREDGSEKGINVCLSLEAILGATGVSTNCAAYGLLNMQLRTLPTTYIDNIL